MNSFNFYMNICAEVFNNLLFFIFESSSRSNRKEKEAKDSRKAITIRLKTYALF